VTIFLLFTFNFVSVGLRVFQQKNVMGNHYWASVPTSYAMSFTFVWNIGMISSEGATMAVFMAVATGSCLGGVGAMYLHGRWFK
jgi:hypothetical protein